MVGAVILEVLKPPELPHELHDCAVAGHYLELESIHYNSLLKILCSGLPKSRNVKNGTMFPRGHYESISSVANLKNFSKLECHYNQKFLPIYKWFKYDFIKTTVIT